MLDLQPIEQRYEAATLGPWEAWAERNDPKPDLQREYGPLIECGVRTAEVHPQLHRKDNIIGIWQSPYCEREFMLRLSAEDAQFIAHARTDIPALVAEVKQLRAEREAGPHDRDCMALMLHEGVPLVCDCCKAKVNG